MLGQFLFALHAPSFTLSVFFPLLFPVGAVDLEILADGATFGDPRVGFFDLGRGGEGRLDLLGGFVLGVGDVDAVVVRLGHFSHI